jgi:hypothetical protein
VLVIGDGDSRRPQTVIGGWGLIPHLWLETGCYRPKRLVRASATGSLKRRATALAPKNFTILHFRLETTLEVSGISFSPGVSTRQTTQSKSLYRSEIRTYYTNLFYLQMGTFNLFFCDAPAILFHFSARFSTCHETERCAKISITT